MSLFRAPENRERGSFYGMLIVGAAFLLTAILGAFGGPSNPLTIFYLVLVVIAAVLLGHNWAWFVAVLTSICFGGLFLFSDMSGHGVEHHHHGSSLSSHLYGMLFSYILVAFLTAFFLSKILKELKARQQKLENMRMNQQKLAAIASIVTDTAHQLGTPLSSIYLAAEELQSAVGDKAQEYADVIDDIDLIAKESVRCRTIIEQLCLRTGSVTGEMMSHCSVDELVEPLRSQYSDVRFVIDEAVSSPRLYIPKDRLTVALRSLIQNALDAHAESGVATPVIFRVSMKDQALAFTVEDVGAGISSEYIERFPEPFLTSKEVGKGMGLGIYIAYLVADSLGATIQYKRNTPNGTVVEFVLPVSDEKKLSEAA